MKELFFSDAAWMALSVAFGLVVYIRHYVRLDPSKSMQDRRARCVQAAADGASALLSLLGAFTIIAASTGVLDAGELAKKKVAVFVGASWVLFNTTSKLLALVYEPIN